MTPENRLAGSQHKLFAEKKRLAGETHGNDWDYPVSLDEADLSGTADYSKSYEALPA